MTTRKGPPTREMDAKAHSEIMTPPENSSAAAESEHVDGIAGHLLTPLEVETATGEVIVIPRHATVHVLAKEVGYEDVGLEDMAEAAQIVEETAK